MFYSIIKVFLWFEIERYRGCSYFLCHQQNKDGGDVEKCFPLEVLIQLKVTDYSSLFYCIVFTAVCDLN